jgi:hypothetical protein
MIKKITLIGCVLGALTAWGPAYAKNTRVHVTLDCSSLGSNVITGYAAVTLCDPSDAACGGASVLCPPLHCDSSSVSAPPSAKITCVAPYPVATVNFSESFVDTSSPPASQTSGSSSGTKTLAKGKVGFVSTQTAGNGDTVTLLGR